MQYTVYFENYKNWDTEVVTVIVITVIVRKM